MPNCSHGNSSAQGKTPRRPPEPPGGLTTCASVQDTAPRGSCGPAASSAGGASYPHPRPSGAPHRVPGPSSFTFLRSPCYSPAPPLGPSLTSPGARGPQRSQRPQASRSAISAPLPQRQQQLWWHKRLKTRSTAGAKRRPGRRSRGERRGLNRGGRSEGERIRLAGAEPTGGPREPRTWDSRTVDFAQRSREDRS